MRRIAAVFALAAGTLVPLSANGYNPSNNRLTGVGYDARGNQTQLNPFTLAYDAENRITSASGAPGTTTYEYDGDGRRVTKVSGAATTIFVYDAFGNLAAEYSTAPSFEGTQFYTADHLGSTRLVTDAGGGVARRYDYLPFGECLAAGLNGRSAKYSCGAFPEVADATTIKFTGKERDAETGLDYFGARYLSSAQGRFTSPDPYMFQNATSQHANDAAEEDHLRDRYISNPQVWNKYTYGLNNPLKFIDPDGKCSQPTNQKEGETGICVEAFIAQNWFKVVGRGDNRGFSGTNKDLTARSRVKLTVSKDGKVTSQEVESARSGVVVKGMGLRGDTVAKTEAKANEDGSVSVHVSLWGRNGEAFLAPLAPSGVLQGHFNLNISNSGQVSFVPQGSSATTFPSWGVYGYGSNGSVQTVKEIPERKIEDLQKPPVPIR